MILLRPLLISLLLLTALAGCQSSAEKKVQDHNRDQRAAFHYRLGIDALHKGLLPKAFEELLLSDSISPDNPETLDAIATSWRLRGNYKEAVTYYERAIDNDSSSATRNNYGSLLVEMGHYKQAIKQLNIALEDPRYRNQSLAFVNLGNAYLGLKNLEEAVKYYRNAHMLSPNWSLPQLREAAAYVQFERPHYAQALYETILRTEPANQEALVGLMALMKGKGADTVLRKYIEAFIKNSPDELNKAWAKDELLHLRK